MNNPIYPQVEVKLIGEDGNAFSIIGLVRRAMKRSKLEDAAIEDFTKEATSGDYNHLLQTCMKYVNVY